MTEMTAADAEVVRGAIGCLEVEGLHGLCDLGCKVSCCAQMAMFQEN